MTIKLNRIARGWYANAEGTWAIIGDDPDSVPTKTEQQESEARGGILTGMASQREWQVVHDPQGRLRTENQVGDTHGWADTKREAVEILNRRAS